MKFADRREAGRGLGQALLHLRDQHPLVLGVAGGGVAVAAEVARALAAPLEVLAARKIRLPDRAEAVIGALAERQATWLDVRALRALEVAPDAVERLIDEAGRELERLVALYRGGRPLPDLRGRTVVLVDDGIASGGTAHAAVAAVRSLDPARLVLAAPVVAASAADALRPDVDGLVALQTPQRIEAVAHWYERFPPIEDAELVRLLHDARERAGAAPDTCEHVLIPAGETTLEGELGLPARAQGAVLIALVESDRHAAHNQLLADELRAGGLATLLCELVSPAEAGSASDPAHLAGRAAAALRWLSLCGSTRGLPIACFAEGAAAAPVALAVAQVPDVATSMVLHDPAADLERVASGAALGVPTLLMVPAGNRWAIAAGRRMIALLPPASGLAVVPDARSAPVRQDAVAGLASRWFTHHTARAPGHAPAAPA